MTLPQVDLSTYLAPERFVRLTPSTKNEALSAMVDLLAGSPEIADPEALHKAIVERESILSTGIGCGIAVPHAKIPSVARFVMAVGVCPEGLQFDSIDDQPVTIVVMIAGPDGQQDQYLRILAKVTLLLRNEEVRARLLETDPESALGVFRTG